MLHAGRQCALLIAMFLVAIWCHAQDKFWHVYSLGSIHSSIKSDNVQGDAVLKSGPCLGWELGLGLNIKTVETFSVGFQYGFGSTPTFVRIEAAKSEYSFLRQDTKTSFYFVQHPYHLLMIVGNKKLLTGNGILQYGLGVRLYPSSSAGVGVTNYTAVGNNRIVVFTSSQRVSLPLCPDMRIGFASPVLKRFPSIKYQVMLSMCPFNAVKGSYVFFPDSSGYTSTGSFVIRQSFISIGIVYARMEGKDGSN